MRVMILSLLVAFAALVAGSVVPATAPAADGPETPGFDGHGLNGNAMKDKGLNDKGMVRWKSPHDVEQTLDRFEQAARARDLRIFARIDHAEGAARIDETLRPTVVVIFGSAKIGTRLLQSSQTVGIDLPLKLLVWQDDQDQTWIAYVDPEYLARRHGIRDREALVDRMQKALAGLASETTSETSEPEGSVADP